MLEEKSIEVVARLPKDTTEEVAVSVVLDALKDYKERVNNALRLLKAFGGGQIIISDVIDILEGKKND